MNDYMKNYELYYTLCMLLYFDYSFAVYYILLLIKLMKYITSNNYKFKSIYISIIVV